MLTAHDTLNKLYAPRKIETGELQDGKIPSQLAQRFSQNHNVILIVRKLEANEGSIAELRKLLDSYTVRATLVDECTQYVTYERC